MCMFVDERSPRQPIVYRLVIYKETTSNKPIMWKSADWLTSFTTGMVDQSASEVTNHIRKT